MADSLNLDRTRTALLIRDQLDAEYEQVVASFDGDVVAWNARCVAKLAEITSAENFVRECFAEDTKDRNSRSSAMAVSIGPWLRKLVAETPPGP